MDELRHAHAQLQAEAAAAQQRYKIASDGAASLQLELSTQRERGDSLAGQVSALSRECETLRNALGGVEGKLTELQKRDVDVSAAEAAAGFGVHVRGASWLGLVLGRKGVAGIPEGAASWGLHQVRTYLRPPGWLPAHGSERTASSLLRHCSLRSRRCGAA